MTPVVYVRGRFACHLPLLSSTGMAAETSSTIFAERGVDKIKTVQTAQQELAGSDRPDVTLMIVQIPIDFFHYPSVRNGQDRGVDHAIVVRRRAVRQSREHLFGIESHED